MTVYCSLPLRHEPCQPGVSKSVVDCRRYNAGNPVTVYCALPLWHEPCQPGVLPEGETTGYISRNGHFFKCHHGSGGGACYSTYFIIDRSGSMSYPDVRPHSPAIRNAPGFSNLLDNRLGVVYEAMHTYSRPGGRCRRTTPSRSSPFVTRPLSASAGRQ